MKLLTIVLLTFVSCWTSFGAPQQVIDKNKNNNNIVGEDKNLLGESPLETYNNRVLVVIGTRPEAVKLAPLVLELKKRENRIKPIVCVTRQHKHLITPILTFFNITPDVFLPVEDEELGSDLIDMMSKMISRLGEKIEDIRPRYVVVQGDTASSLAAGQAAHLHKVEVIHVEAGLRTFQRFNPFPEEVFRRMLSVLATVHFAPTERSAQNLRRENIPNIHVVGNTAVDALLLTLSTPASTEAKALLDRAINKNAFNILVTAHRRENLEFALPELVSALSNMCSNQRQPLRFIFSVHPRPSVHRFVHDRLQGSRCVMLLDAPPYEPFLRLIQAVDLILSDSGGLQEEAATLGIPMLLMRNFTERPEGVDSGNVKLVGPSSIEIEQAVNQILNDQQLRQSMQHKRYPFGNGTASVQIADYIVENGSKDTSVFMEAALLDQQCSIMSVQTPPTTSSSLASVPIESKIEQARIKRSQSVEIERSERNVAQLSLADLLQVPSAYPGRLPRYLAEITIILTVYRRPNLLKRMMQSLVVQTAPVKELWVCTWHSPKEFELRNIFEDFRSNYAGAVKLRFVSGDVDLKYYGRFQIGLQAKTPYVSFVDDDCIPGENWMENALHTINTADYHGIIGAKAIIFDPEFEGLKSDFVEKTNKTSSIRVLPYVVTVLDGTFLISPETIRPVDLVGGIWFGETSWVKLMFYDRPYTFTTAEDHQYSFSAAKHANIRSFILPGMPWGSPDAGVSEDHLLISAAGESTVVQIGTEDMLGVRTTVHTYLFQRGMWHHKKNGPIETGVVFVDTVNQARKLKTIWPMLNEQVKTSTRIVISGRPSTKSGIQNELDEIIHDLNMEESHYHPSILNLGLFTDFGVRESRMKRSHFLSQTSSAAEMIFTEFEPFFVLLFDGNEQDNGFLAATALVAEDFGSPIVAVLEHKSSELFSNAIDVVVSELHAAANWINRIWSDRHQVINQLPLKPKSEIIEPTTSIPLSEDVSASMDSSMNVTNEFTMFGHAEWSEELIVGILEKLQVESRATGFAVLLSGNYEESLPSRITDTIGNPLYLTEGYHQNIGARTVHGMVYSDVDNRMISIAHRVLAPTGVLIVRSSSPFSIPTSIGNNGIKEFERGGVRCAINDESKTVCVTWYYRCPLVPVFSDEKQESCSTPKFLFGGIDVICLVDTKGPAVNVSHIWNLPLHEDLSVKVFINTEFYKETKLKKGDRDRPGVLRFDISKADLFMITVLVHSEDYNEDVASVPLICNYRQS